MRGLMIIAALAALAGCSKPNEPAFLPMPRPEFDRLIATCPDPEVRQLLKQGATFRGLAKSRAEALDGWQRCFDAAKENGAG